MPLPCSPYWKLGRSWQLDVLVNDNWNFRARCLIGGCYRSSEDPERPWPGRHRESRRPRARARRSEGDAEDTVQAISTAVSKERERYSNGVAIRVKEAIKGTIQSDSKRGGGFAGMQVGGKAAQLHMRPATKLFGEAAASWSGARIIVFVDEVQNIPIGEGAKATLDRLHRGTENVELLPVFFGLSETHRGLGECGLSRPRQSRLIEMGQLTIRESSASLDVTFSAYGIGEQSRSRTKWINRLAEESQGWPQHLNRLAVTAGVAERRYHPALGMAPSRSDSIDDRMSLPVEAIDGILAETASLVLPRRKGFASDRTS